MGARRHDKSCVVYSDGHLIVAALHRLHHYLWGLLLRELLRLGSHIGNRYLDSHFVAFHAILILIDDRNHFFVIQPFNFFFRGKQLKGLGPGIVEVCLGLRTN